MNEPSIYRYPAIFRRVHMESAKEIGEEVRFLGRVWRRHLDRPVRRVLDVAAGNSPHGQMLARSGVAVVGVDHSPSMIAAGRAEARGLRNFRLYRREIAGFRLPERDFDAAFFMSETFTILISNRDLLSHLRSVGRILRRGGLYCVDIDRHDRSHQVRSRRLWRRRKVHAGETTVDVREFNRSFPWYAGLHSIYELECRIRFPNGTVTTRDVIPIRDTLPCTFELAARASGMFQMVAAYTDLSLTTPLDRCQRRWMGVLRRI
jgi:SAM-dependent methyltransferase